MNRNTALQVLIPTAVIAVVIIAIAALSTWGNNPTTGEGKSPANVSNMPSVTAAEWKPHPSGMGLKIWDVEEGSGEGATPAGSVTVHYTGWLASNGNTFDTSYKGEKEPITFPLNKVIEGWTVGLTGMKVGGTRRLYIPSGMAYGGKKEAWAFPRIPIWSLK